MAHYLTVYEPPYTKRRVGKDNDGGYVICQLDGGYDAFISGGVFNDISFEEQFLKENPDLRCIAFDNSAVVTSTNDRLEIIKKNIGIFNTDSTVNLHPLVAKYSNIMMKMDIEGGERELFYTLTDEDLQNIKQLVIEIHSNQEVVIPLRLAQTHWLVHLHVNNYQYFDAGHGIRNIHGTRIPEVYEATYVRKNPGDDFKPNTTTIPDPLLDQPNFDDRPDTCITWPPFVN